MTSVEVAEESCGKEEEERATMCTSGKGIGMHIKSGDCMLRVR